jgi:hypothetical protein
VVHVTNLDEMTHYFLQGHISIMYLVEMIFSYLPIYVFLLYVTVSSMCKPRGLTVNIRIRN